LFSLATFGKGGKKKKKPLHRKVFRKGKEKKGGGRIKKIRTRVRETQLGHAGSVEKKKKEKGKKSSKPL